MTYLFGGTFLMWIMWLKVKLGTIDIEDYFLSSPPPSVWATVTASQIRSLNTYYYLVVLLSAIRPVALLKPQDCEQASGINAGPFQSPRLLSHRLVRLHLHPNIPHLSLRLFTVTDICSWTSLFYWNKKIYIYSLFCCVEPKWWTDGGCGRAEQEERVKLPRWES